MNDVEKKLGEAIAIIHRLIDSPRNPEIIADAELWLKENSAQQGVHPTGCTCPLNYVVHDCPEHGIPPYYKPANP